MRCGRMVERWRCVSTNLLRLMSVSSSESPRHLYLHKVPSMCDLTGGERNCGTKLQLVLSSPSLLLLLPFSPPLLSSPSSPPPPLLLPSLLSYILPLLPPPLLSSSSLPSPSPQQTQTTFPSPKWLHASQGVVRCVSPLLYSMTPL